MAENKPYIEWVAFNGQQFFPIITIETSSIDKQ